MTDTSNVKNMHNGHEFVDLGLPSGLLWATCNVGATSPEQTGLYFAWGETTGYTAEQVTSGVRKFDLETYNAGSAASISADLTLAQDAARANLGGKWRMSTKTEYQELIDNCKTTWTKDYKETGVPGMLFTSKINGISVFFPASGYCNNSSVSKQGWGGIYWSASWDSFYGAWDVLIDSEYVDIDVSDRYYGQSVRAVCER